jgi:hypothetical protein
MALAFFLRGLDTLSLLPALVGVLSMLFRWRWGALYVLLFAAWLLIAQRWPIFHPAFVAEESARLIQEVLLPSPMYKYGRTSFPISQRTFGIVDVLLVVSLLVYVAAHFRLLGLTRWIFPADPRRSRLAPQRARGPRAPAERRSSDLVTGHEIVVLVASAPLWLGLAWLCWRWLERKETVLDIDDYAWQAMILAWLLGVLFFVASGLVRYVAQGHVRPEEAALFLQDTLWRETSREQRRINRWLVWARRRQRQKEET